MGDVFFLCFYSEQLEDVKTLGQLFYESEANDANSHPALLT